MLRPDCQAFDREPPAEGIVLHDVDGTFKRCFDDLEGGVVILRPDRIVAAVCKPWEPADTMRALADKMNLHRGA